MELDPEHFIATCCSVSLKGDHEPGYRRNAESPRMSVGVFDGTFGSAQSTAAARLIIKLLTILMFSWI
jgi:hypothetical protein